MAETEISATDAAAHARAAIGLDAAVPARAWWTRRLDRPGAAYYLVIFGQDQAVVAVAAVEAASGDVLSTAWCPGLGPHLAIDAAEAVNRTALRGDVGTQLVWQPCRASRSPLYPIWEVRSASATRYVDQQGQVWQSLVPAGRGG